LALIVAGVWAAWSSGKRSDPTSPAERAEKPDGVSKPKDTPPEPMAKPPAPKRPTTPVPGEARDIEIAPGVKMAFCWVPASGGEVQLGSPKSGRDLVLKAAPESKQAGWLASEAEGVRGKFKTGGFWMGQYEVTQAEWKAVVGDNPSYFDGTKDNKAKGMDTSRFPVESVSWDRICGRGKYAGTGFLDKIDHGGIRRALGTAGRFRLPTENEWEYACRGGRGNGRAFFWGDALNGTQANCCGSVFPFGTAEKGAYLGRPCPVDFTGDGKYKPHPWGLMHMHGNVYEWCEDFYDTKDNGHVLRGGSWGSYGHICRAANRHGDAPDNDTSRIGFRLLALGLP
jgi:formylglycine-generating enzyme required for sulfatase activity